MEFVAFTRIKGDPSSLGDNDDSHNNVDDNDTAAAAAVASSDTYIVVWPVRHNKLTSHRHIPWVCINCFGAV